MIFSKCASEPETNTKDKVSWRKRFAIFPQCVAMDEASNTETYVWLGFYEVRRYWEKDHGWWREYRLPEAQNSWREDADCFSGFKM